MPAGSRVALHLIVVGVSPAAGGADTHFYGQFWARLRPKLPVTDAFLLALRGRQAVKEITTIYWGVTGSRRGGKKIVNW